jgi:hypothetical protein
LDPDAPEIGNATLNGDGVFSVTASGASGSGYAFQYSVNLQDWFTLFVVSGSVDGMLDAADVSAGSSNRRFYRLVGSE